jgi:drug/metabolite transporter (DMT)-like permease
MDNPQHGKSGGTSATLAMLSTGMAVFGTATPVSKLIGHDFPPLLAGLLRVALGAAILAALAWPAGRQLRGIGGRDWLRIGAIALFGMFGFSVFMLYGMQSAPGAVGATVMSMTPAITATAAMLFLGERASWRKLAAVALAVAGAAVLELGQGAGQDSGQASGGHSVLFGGALVLAAVCCESAYTLLGQRVSRNIDPVLVAALGAVLSIPLFLIGSAVVGNWSIDASPGGWAALVWYGAGTLALGSWLWYRGIARVSGVTAAACMGVMPLSCQHGEARKRLKRGCFASTLPGQLG